MTQEIDGDVHVWRLRLDRSPESQRQLAALLSPPERKRAERFAAPRDRNRYVAAHGFLRVVLSRYLGIPPETIEFDAGDDGKPRLAGRESPHFSLSHAGALALVAVSPVREVGVDLEEIRDLPDIDSLANSCFSPAELDEYRSLPVHERLGAFFAGWTRKEAFLKLLGTGLSLRLDSFDVSLAPGAPPRLLRLDGDPDAPARYAVEALYPARGYAAALASAR